MRYDVSKKMTEQLKIKETDWFLTQYETSNDTSGRALTSLSEKKYRNWNKKLIPDLIYIRDQYDRWTILQTNIKLMLLDK